MYWSKLQYDMDGIGTCQGIQYKGKGKAKQKITTVSGSEPSSSGSKIKADGPAKNTMSVPTATRSSAQHQLQGRDTYCDLKHVEGHLSQPNPSGDSGITRENQLVCI